MTDARAAAVDLEVLASGTPDARTAAVAVEALVSPSADARVAAAALAVLGSGSPDARVAAAALAVLVPAYVGYQSEVHKDSPLAYYRLGEPSGTAMVDSSGMSHNGSYTGSPTLGVTGLIVGDSDTAVTFASGKYATVAYASWMNVTTFTVEVTIKLSSIPTGSRATIFSRDNETSARAFSFQVNTDGKLEGLLFFGGSPYFVTGTTVLTTGVTYTVALKFDGSYAKLYLNGVEDGTLTHSGSLDTTTGVGIYIGCSPYSNRYPFTGTIDDVSYYGSGLSATRLYAHASFAAGVAPDATIAATLVAAVGNVPFSSPPFGATITPDSVVAAGATPAPLIAITVDAVAVAASTPAPTPTASSSASASVIPAVSTVPLPPSIVGATNETVTAVLVTAAAIMPDVAIIPGPARVQVTATVPTVQAVGQLTLITPDVIAATAHPLPPLYVQDDHVEIALSNAVVATAEAPALTVSVGATITGVAVAAIATTPAPIDTFPPGPITDFTSSVTDPWSVTFTWANPTDPDFDHALILRRDGLPYAEPGDDLLDTSIVVVETTGLGGNNYDELHPYPVASGTFHDVQNTTGRPDSGYRWSAASWYRYTPIVDGTLTIDTIGNPDPDWDTYLTIYDTLPPPDDQSNYLAASDDDGGDHGGTWGTSWIQIEVTAGTTYWICAQGYNDNYIGDIYFNLSGPDSSEIPPSSSPTYVDSGLTSGQTYYYSVYAIDSTGNASYSAVTATVDVPGLPSGNPLVVTVSMLAGSVTLLAGTPVEPAASEDIIFYGDPIAITLTEPAGVTWVNDLLQPPPAVPGATTGWPGNLIDPAIVRTPTDIRAEIWDFTNTTKLSNLDYSAAREFLDEYNGVGSGSLQVPAVHPDAALLRRDRVLRFYYKDITDAVFASIIEGRKTNVVAEAGSNWAAVNGRGLLAWLEDAVVLPYLTDEDKAWLQAHPSGYKTMPDGTRTPVISNIMPYAPDVRAFNFGSRDAFNHILFNDVGPGSSGSNQELLAPWSNLTSGDGVTYAARSDKVRGYPIGWPDPSAQWIWQTNPQADVQDGLQVSFRGFFNLSAQTTVDIYGTADDTATFYIDGKQKLFSTPGHKTMGHIRITLAAGQHELQITGRNAYLPALALNPASVIATIKNASGGSVLFRTNTTQWQYTRWINNFLITEADHGPGWHRPLGIAQSAKAPLNIKQFFPTDWPDPAAQWIWGSDPSMTSEAEQICWFRAKVWIETSGTYRWFCTADDGYIMWIDGIEVLSLEYNGSAANGWMRTDEIDLKLDRGFHVFAMRGRNQTNAAQYTQRGNPAAVLGTLMTLDSNLKPYAPVTTARTYYTGSSPDVGWYANWAAPAWKAGDVLYTLVNEAKARGVTRLQNVSMDFNATTDSNGQEWTTRVSRTWDVGTSLLQVSFDLCELGVDIWMTPDNVLHCAERRGSDVPTFSVLYGKNISGYDVDETFTGASIAYTRTRTGWFTLENDTSQVILGGKRETGISLANTDAEDVMIDVSHRAIGAVVMANMVATAQSIVPVDGSVPYVDANISDIIYVLSPDGSSRMGRLLSISITENEAGATTWVPEIEIWNSPFGEGVDPSKPHDPVDPNSPYDPSTWVPAAEDWTRFIPDGAGSDYPRAVTLAQASSWVDGTPSPSPSGATPVPLNSAQAPRPVVNEQNNATPPNAERVAVAPTAPLTTAGYHLWVDTSGLV